MVNFTDNPNLSNIFHSNGIELHDHFALVECTRNVLTKQAILLFWNFFISLEWEMHSKLTQNTVHNEEVGFFA